MPRAMLFIDGSNFYHRLKDLRAQLSGKYSLLDFDYGGFAKFLTSPNEVVGIRYYVGAIRNRGDEKSEGMYANQQKLLAKLNAQNVNVTLGQLIQHPDRSFHEKGVDVRLAVEMIRLARENNYDIGYLLSSDTDLVAAAEEVKLLGKKIYYIGTSRHQSFGLSKISNETRLLRAEELEPFLGRMLI